MLDKQLVNQFLKFRIEYSFRPIYKKHANDLMKTALFLTKFLESEADDLFQDTWEVAINKLEEFKFKSSLKTWLTAIMINKFMEMLRKRSPFISEQMNEHNTGILCYDKAIDVRKAVLMLPLSYRTVFTLHDIQGYKHREIGNMLGIQTGTSKSQLYYARKRLREILKSYSK